MLRIFLVEDESAVRESLRDMVPWNQYGYALAGEAGDGEMALPLIRQTKPDVLITDIRMPFMDGLALSELVSREFPEMKIVVVSGCDDFACAQRAIDIGVERYLLKPVSRRSLLQALEEIRKKIRVAGWRRVLLPPVLPLPAGRSRPTSSTPAGPSSRESWPAS